MYSALIEKGLYFFLLFLHHPSLPLGQMGVLQAFCRFTGEALGFFSRSFGLFSFFCDLCSRLVLPSRLQGLVEGRLVWQNLCVCVCAAGDEIGMLSTSKGGQQAIVTVEWVRGEAQISGCKLVGGIRTAQRLTRSQTSDGAGGRANQCQHSAKHTEQ